MNARVNILQADSGLFIALAGSMAAIAISIGWGLHEVHLYAFGVGWTVMATIGTAVHFYNTLRSDHRTNRVEFSKTRWAALNLASMITLAGIMLVLITRDVLWNGWNNVIPEATALLLPAYLVFLSYLNFKDLEGLAWQNVEYVREANTTP